MKSRQLVCHLVCSGAMCALVALSLAANASAATIEIQFTGLDLTYDGSTLSDSGSSAGGLGNPADADPLLNVDFVVDGTLVGSLSDDISVDVSIPNVTGIPSASGTVHNVTTPGNPGYFDLLFGTAPLASEFLIVNLEEVTVTYVDVLNVVQFTFGAAVSDIFGDNLPFNLGINDSDPVTVSFSAQIVQGTRTEAAGFITGFKASGTGEVAGTYVPEPSTCLLAAFGLVGWAVRRK